MSDRSTSPVRERVQEGVLGRARPDGPGTAPATPEQHRASPRAVKGNVLFVCLAAIAATAAASLTTGLHGHEWMIFVVLAAAAATAQLFGVDTTHNQSYHQAIVFVIAGSLLLPPPLLALLCLVQHVPEWIKTRLPLEIQAFNVANYTLAGLAGWLGARLVESGHAVGANERTAVAGLAACLAFVLVNHGFLGVMLRIARGHTLRQSGLFTFESLSTDVVLALIGVGIAAWWRVDPWFVPIAVVPLVLVHRALKIPRLRAEASSDAKTGLFNAGHLKTALEEELARAARFRRQLSVIVADLDLLREINNNHGHLTGDAVLVGVADVFRSLLRPFDVAARFGGEEFAVVLPETPFEEALAIAERVRQAVEAKTFVRHGSNEAVPATISIGVATFPQDATDPEGLVHEADLALYRSKALGRNRVCGASPESRALKLLTAEPEPKPVPPASAEPPAPRLVAAATDQPHPKVSRRFPTPRRLRRPDEAKRDTPSKTPIRAPRSVLTLIGVLTAGAAALLALDVPQLVHSLPARPWAVLGFALVVLGLQLLSADLYGTGAEAASATGMLSAGFVLGPEIALVLAMIAACVQWILKRGLFHRALFDIANFALPTAAAAYTYHALAGNGPQTSVALRLVGAMVATVVFKALNSGVLCLAMSLSESLPFSKIWNERFRWASLHYLAFGPLAFATALAYEQMGLVGLAAFALPPALLTVSVRLYLGHTRSSVEEVRRANEELQQTNTELEQSNERVRRTHLATIAALSRSMEAKDHDTGGHTERVAAIAVALAHRLGYRGEELHAIEVGALLHDIGKIGIPESVLHKTGPLSEEEWMVMRKHPVVSDYILSEVDVHPFVRQIARWSHERIDGTGYPDALSGNEIPMPARIALVADAFDAITSDRPYRRGRGVAEALEELREHAGTQFCPLVVGALEQIWRERPELLALLPEEEEVA